MKTVRAKSIRCLLLDDDSMDAAFTSHCLVKLFGAEVVITHAQSVAEADEALKYAAFDIVILDYYVGGRTPMSLLRHFEDSSTMAAILVLSSVHPSIVAPFLAAVGKGSFLDKTAFSARMLSRALESAGIEIVQADAATGNDCVDGPAIASLNIA